MASAAQAECSSWLLSIAGTGNIVLFAGTVILFAGVAVFYRWSIPLASLSLELALGVTAEKCQSIFGSGSGPNGQRP